MTSGLSSLLPRFTQKVCLKHQFRDRRLKGVSLDE